MTRRKLMRLHGYVDQDAERICLSFATHPKCGAYLCGLAKGHQNGDDPRLKKHQAACRKHHCHLIIWEDENGSSRNEANSAEIGAKPDAEDNRNSRRNSL